MIAGTLLCILEGVSLAQSGCPYNFDPTTVGADTYRDAVFSIGKRDGKKYEHLGTAYLVAASAPYLLTAKHVLGSREIGETIDGASDSFTDEKYAFSIVQVDEDNDVALLKMVEGEIPDGLRPFELRTIPPAPSENLHMWGHPVYADDYSRGYSNPKYRRTRRTGQFEGTYELVGNTLEGASGSPLFDDQGRVVGTVIQGSNDSQLGVARPSSASVRLLIPHIVLSSKGDRLKSVLLSGSVSLDAVATSLYLEPANASNMELLVVSRQLSDSVRNGTPDIKPLLSCPLWQAIVQRGMTVPDAGSAGQDALELLTYNLAGKSEELLKAGKYDESVPYLRATFESGMIAVEQIASRYPDWHQPLSCSHDLAQVEIVLPDRLYSLQKGLDSATDEQCHAGPNQFSNLSNRVSRFLAMSAMAETWLGNITNDDSEKAHAQQLASLAALASNEEPTLQLAYAVLGDPMYLDGMEESKRRTLIASFWLTTDVEDLKPNHSEYKRIPIYPFEIDDKTRIAIIVPNEEEILTPVAPPPGEQS
jgi:hypothetical protein